MGALEGYLSPPNLPASTGRTIELGFPHDMLASDNIRMETRGDLKVDTRRDARSSRARAVLPPPSV